MIMISSPVPKIKRHVTEVAAAVVDGEKEPAGQGRQLRLGAESRVETRHERSDVGHTSADAGQRGRNDVPDALVGLRRQKPSFLHRTNEAVGHWVG
jgi:hypothetical protein